MRSRAYRGLVPLLLLLVGALCAGPSPRGPIRLSGMEVYRHTLAAVAWVRAADSGQGTGWIVDRARRRLVTNYHVVGENETVEVIFPVRRQGEVIAERGYYIENRSLLHKNGCIVRGRVLHREKETDLALVELETLPDGVAELPLVMGGACPGDTVHVVGNRYDTSSLWVFSTGSVRQVETLREGYFNGGRQLAKGVRVVVASAPINEGDSGGPLVNDRGEVVGVAAAVAWESHGAGLFIDVGELRAFLSRAPNARPTDNPLSLEATWNRRSTARDVYRQGLRSFVLVHATGDKRASGWLLDHSRRLLVTTSEAVGKRETVDVTFPVYRDGSAVGDATFYRDAKQAPRVPACVLATDPRRNLALLELKSLPDGVEEVRFAANQPAPGDAVHSLGNPERLGALWVYTSGSVRQLGRANLGQTADEPDPAILLVQAPVQDGDGGGPLLDDRGEFVGVVSGKGGPQQLVSYCLTAEEVLAFLEEKRPLWSPRDAAELCARGALFTKARQYERAVLDFTAALRADPAYARAFAERGKAYQLQGEHDKALADCDAALKLDPRQVTAYCHRAAARCDRGEPALAVEDCDAALKLEPRCAIAFAFRAQARRLLGDFDKALADCDEAIWLDRQLPIAPLQRGLVHAAKGDHDKALVDYTQALRLDPRLALAHRCRAEAYWAKSDVAAALADYNDALSLASGDARAYHGRGWALAAKEEYTRAMADFTEAIRLDVRFAAAYQDRGTLLLRAGEVKKGLADYTSAMKLQPELTGEMLAMIEKRASELCREGREDFTACCELCRSALLAFQPFFQEKPAIRKLIEDGLGAAGRETELRKQADALRGTIAAARTALAKELERRLP
jgi:S1-C subfamily serine protease/tetratricopeptide (TPR) repeat protein